MTKQERADRNRVDASLIALGFSQGECNKLRRISEDLHTWYEMECNYCIMTGFMRDGEFVECSNREECKELGSTCKAYIQRSGQSPITLIPDSEHLEKKATKQLDAMIQDHNASGKPLVAYYLQTDPRGAALYIIPMARYEEYCTMTNRKSDGQFDAIYISVGICVY